MTGNDLHTLRRRLGLSYLELGRAIGHTGKPNTVRTYLRRCERMGTGAVPPTLAAAVEMHGLRERAGLAPLKART
jgi:hypothetical protein